MSGNAVGRARRWLSIGTTGAGLAISALGVVVLVRAGAPPETSAPLAATSTTAAAPMTTTTRPLPQGWRACTHDHLRVAYPPGWATTKSGSDACTKFRPIDSGDAGTGYVVVARVRSMTLDAYARRLAQGRYGDGRFTTSFSTRNGRRVLRATASDPHAPGLPVATIFAVRVGNDAVLVTSYSAGLSTEGERELITMATSMVRA